MTEIIITDMLRVGLIIGFLMLIMAAIIVAIICEKNEQD